MYIRVDISYTSCMCTVFLLFTVEGLEEQCISFGQVFVVYFYREAGCQLNTCQAFRRPSWRVLNVLCKLNLLSASKGFIGQML